jgi:sialate O-acetylesterase
MVPGMHIKKRTNFIEPDPQMEREDFMVKKILGLVCILFLTCLALFSQETGAQDLKMPAIFSNNMVLQRDIEIPVWGQGKPDSDVSLLMTDIKLKCKSDASGKWMTRIPPRKAGGPFEMTIESKGEKIAFKNVMFGDVWVCSGQSNMVWTLSKSLNGEKEAMSANYPNIRLFTVKRQIAASPLSDTEGSWAECSPSAVNDFSGVGYFFGKEIHKNIEVPIGLIQSAWGGTPIESWMSEEVLKSDPDFLPIYGKWKELLDNYPEKKEDYDKKLTDWEKRKKEAEQKGEPVPRKPVPPTGPNSPRQPNVLFNGLVSPIIPYGIKGVIWYQGESNANRGYQYRKLFPAMIADWRKRWALGDFPFLFVQIANFQVADPKKGTWPELREAQLMTIKKSPNTGMAVTIDIGEPKDIHPRNKEDVGKRLALCAMKFAYGKDIEYSGPIYRDMAIEGEKIRISFDHAGGGLISRNNDPLKGFVICGEDRIFMPAQAKIEGNTVIAWNESVKNPVAVRYGWESAPEVNLYNITGLPASPFRTDNFTGDTEGNNTP